MRVAHFFAIITWTALSVLIDLAPAAADKRVALIIANGAYQHVPRLTNPRNDAELMAETLRNLGFILIGDRAQVDLDKAGFDSAVQSFGAQLQGADVGLFYYAGHGVQVRGANYLVPIGANPTKEADVDFQMLDANLVLRQMEGSGTKLNVVILDACRNNPFGGRGLRATSRGLAQMQAPEGTLISYATQPGNVAQDGSDGNSPYAKALAQTMRRAGLDVFQTFNEVGLAVKNATGGSQQPWVSSSPIAGNFYFAGAPTTPDDGTTPPTQALVSPLDRAGQAWMATQNTTSVAVLEDFIRQFGSTVYGSMARARLDELKKSQVVVVPSLVPPDKLVSSAPSNSSASVALHPFDGKWTITRNGSGCPIQTYTFTITIENSKTEGKAGGGSVKGSVAPTGAINFNHPAATGPISVTFSGSLRGDTGNGSFRTPGCSGTFTAKKD